MDKQPPPTEAPEDVATSLPKFERSFPGFSGAGALMAGEKLGLLAQAAAAHEALLAKYGTLRPHLAGPLLGEAIDCALVKPSRFYSRCEVDFVPELDLDFEKLVASIRTNGGNSIPAMVHRCVNEPKEYEIIYGHRRWAACRAAGVPLIAIVKEGLPLKEIAKLQLAENSNRLLSPS
ncbi:ParB N-terminal domain-containing protein [Thermomonas fusca]